jgi:hypothetical protein
MKNAIKLIAVLGLALGLGGCPQGQAKVFAQTQTGGTFILEGDEGKAMQDADKKMAMHCGVGNYQIVSRDTVVVGHENYSDSVAQQQGTTDTQSAGVVSTAGSSTSDSASQGSSAAVVGSDGYGNAYGAEGHQDSSSTVNTNEQTTAAAAASSTQTQGVQTASSVSGNREVRELRLTYACAGAGPAPAPAAAAPAQP